MDGARAWVDRSHAFLSQKSGKEMYNSCMGKFGKAQVSRSSALCSGRPGHPAGRLPPARAAVTPCHFGLGYVLCCPPPPPSTQVLPPACCLAASLSAPPPTTPTHAGV